MEHTLSYWLDAMNVIRRVDENWDSAMNSESWTDRAASYNIVDKPLFDFICDDVTRMYIATMVESVRVLPMTLFRPYRCDTHDFKRFMMMTITPEDDGLVRVSHELLRTEPMAKKVSFKTLSPEEQSRFSSSHTDVTLLGIHYIRCSRCNRICKVGQNDWQEADSVTLTSETIRVFYGLCPSCMRQPP